MPATRSQTGATEKPPGTAPSKKRAARKTKPSVEEEPPTKKLKTDEQPKEEENKVNVEHYQRATGCIERGHIYFFYRPRVQLEEAHSLDDVQRLHILLVPRPPDFSASAEPGAEKPETDDTDMKVLKAGADAIPAPVQLKKNKFYRLITMGKKQLPDPDHSGRKDIFWATVATVGEDLDLLEEGLGEKSYETKTRGTRHNEPARLAARGVYALVNNDANVPSNRETHLGYRLSHPFDEDLGDVQEQLRIRPASSFILQAKNPLAPSTNPAMRNSKGADYPEHIMKDIFGKGGTKGRESYGLRFASCESVELLNYQNAELLFIAARSGDGGLEKSLGEGRGEALTEIETQESQKDVDDVLEELKLDAEKFPPDALKGEWL